MLSCSRHTQQTLALSMGNRGFTCTPCLDLDEACKAKTWRWHDAWVKHWREVMCVSKAVRGDTRVANTLYLYESQYNNKEAAMQHSMHVSSLGQV
jgi:hypothetical protein